MHVKIKYHLNYLKQKVRKYAPKLGHVIFPTTFIFYFFCQNKRQKILTAIIKNRHMVSVETLEQLDLNVILGKTEGYVAQDLENLISRAIHSHTLKQGKAAYIQVPLQLNSKETFRCTYMYMYVCHLEKQELY